ncbi:MAG: hypothetical protein IT450_04655 [Phycisphaerales bacterium]|nr:hypothetical protein [Phycisphaerales bacterium]
MGAKTWMLVYSTDDPCDVLASQPVLDRAQSERFAQTLFPGQRLKAVDDGDLCWTAPDENELLVGCFPGVSIVAATEFGIDYPSQLDQRFIKAGGKGLVYLHAMHSVVDWFAFAIWENGKLIRSLSLSPDSGILEDIGTRCEFEEPYWSGEFPAVEPGEDDDPVDYPIPFHPLELAEAALLALLGYQIEGPAGNSRFDPETISLMRFARSRTR